MNRRTFAALVTLAGFGAAAGCRPAPTPTAVPPTAVPTPAAAAPAEPSGPALGAASVKAIRAGVAVGDATLEADAEAPLADDAALAVPERGMAVVKWAEGARIEAPGAALALESADGKRRLAVRQTAGTARYTTPANAADGAIGLNVATERAVIHAAGPADVIVSLDPASLAGTLWVIVVDGAVKITGGAPVASTSGAAAPLQAAVASGQAIAIRASGGEPNALPIDLATVETWYGGLVAGDGSPLASMAAYRCVVVADGSPLLAQPDAKASSVDNAPLRTGTLIDVRGRTKDSRWLQAYFPATELSGWLPAAALQCVAPAEALAVVDPTTVHNVDRAALAVGAPVVVSFTADKTEIASGACAKLNWDVGTGTNVKLEGQPVPGKGFKLMCPPVTSTYTLSWVDESGKPQSRRVTVTVSAALASAATGDGGGNSRVVGATGGPEPVPTVCVGPECEVVVPTPPPTATRRLRPTPAPAPADPTDAPPPPPGPTDAPPPVAPTDRPDPGATETPAPVDPTATETPGAPPTETPAPTEPPVTPEPSLTPNPTPSPTPTP